MGGLTELLEFKKVAPEEKLRENEAVRRCVEWESSFEEAVGLLEPSFVLIIL